MNRETLTKKAERQNDGRADNPAAILETMPKFDEAKAKANVEQAHAEIAKSQTVRSQSISLEPEVQALRGDFTPSNSINTPAILGVSSQSVNYSDSNNPNNENLDGNNNIDERIAQFVEILGSNKHSDSTTAYNHYPTNIETVLANPEEFIIPECLPACHALWRNNLVTAQCSNYDDDHFWIEVDKTSLSPRNLELFEKNCGENYSVGREVHDNCFIYVSGTTPEDAEKLTQLASIFEMQDVPPGAYMSADEFLERYRHEGGEPNYELEEDGALRIARTTLTHPDATIADALRDKGMESLYVPEENRVYASKEFLEGHRRFLAVQNATTLA